MSKFRNLLLSVLSTTATKREAQNYIQKYGSSHIGNPGAHWKPHKWPGSLDIAQPSPKLISLVLIGGRNCHEALSEPWVTGIARTLSHIKDLGGSPVVVIDGSPQIEAFLGPEPKRMREYESQLTVLSEKLASELTNFGSKSTTLASPLDICMKDGYVIKNNWLNRTLAQDQIPILLPLMYDLDTNETKMSDSFVLCRELARVLTKSPETGNGVSGACDPTRSDSLVCGSAEVRTELDKVIFIDSLGGLPSQRRKHAAHVLVNLKQEFGEISTEIRTTKVNTSQDKAKRDAHLANLEAMSDILSIGGPQTTGIITDPCAASNVLDRNPIIYNILTDRPLISPSLPADLERTQLRTSVLRTGFPVYVRSSSEDASLDLRREDKVGNINLTKLKRLIELSFKKTLDLNHYLSRIQDNLAAIIVVGDYDGAAIITWETSSLTGRRIAYLDKFVVDPSSQGAQGVADIMLIQMIRRLFPHEMLWRSRYNNPVNKWYFERSRGHCRLPESIWTMFWISDAEVPPIEEYESVCRYIEPSLIAVDREKTM